MRIEAHHPEELVAVTEVIHDEWFDVSDVHYDSTNRVIRVPFERAAGKRGTEPVEWILEIGDVRDWVLEESEGIGRYDFNELEYSPVNGRLTIRTAIPLKFRLDVGSLRVAAYEQVGS